MPVRLRAGAIRGLWVLSLLLLILFPTTTVEPAAAAEDNASFKIDRLVFPVTLSNGTTYSVVGYLYYHGSFRSRLLQVLIPDATYDHRYFDVPPINGHTYSYARYMADQHYAVLALDTLGSGESSRPDGDFLTVQETAESLHQVLRSVHN